MNFLLLSALLLSSFADNTQCQYATPVDFINNNEMEITEDITQIESSLYKIGKNTFKQPGHWYHVHTEGEGDVIEIDTCFSGYTNFDTKIMVFGECNNGVATKLLTYNDDSVSACSSAARLLFNDKNKQNFYVFITGSSEDDVGIYGLRMIKQNEHSNTFCNNPLSISIPSIHEGTTTAIAPNLNDLSGLFYSVRGTGERIYISTCHRATNVETVITVLDNCNSPTILPMQNEQCQNQMLGSLIQFDSVAGKTYIVHISSSLKRRGMFIAMFEDDKNPITNSETCEKATAITTIPFTSTTRMDGVTQSLSCDGKIKQGSWYSIVGDGNDYIFHTCNSMNGPQDSTMIEIFESCVNKKNCESNSNGCGLHGKIIKHLDVGKNYFVKVSCSNPQSQCRVTLSIDKISSQSGINSCVFAKVIHLERESDEYADSFDITHTKKSQIHCGGYSERHGVWYKVINDLKSPFSVFVQAHVLLATSAKHTAEIQMYRTCSLDCEEHQQSVGHVTLKPKESDKFRFISEKNSIVPHDTCKTALELNMPFSLVEYKPNVGKSTSSICTKDQVGKHVGLYYYFQSTITDTIIIETCGLETQFDTYVEVFMGCGKDSVCVLSNDDSPECGSVASYVRFEAQQGAEYYIYVSEANKAIDTEGTFRLNVYTFNPPEHSSCEKAEPLTPGLIQHALTKYAFESVSNCELHHHNHELVNGHENKKEFNEHLKGVWYTYTATVNGKLHINTCNAGTSVRSRIGIYRTCTVMNGINVPGECVTENSVSYQSCSTRGTQESAIMTQGQTVYIFVGGETPYDVGFVAVHSDFESSDKTYKKVLHTARVGPKRIKERRSNWVLWGIILTIYTMVCLIIFAGLKTLQKKEDNLGYHEL
ncbi:Bacterial pre-peptidase c-terminal domain containing protein [Entamoeba marina]